MSHNSMQLEKISQERTFWEMDADGCLQEVDMFTGEVVNRTKNINDILMGGEIPHSMIQSKIQWVYSEKIAQIICGLVASGDTLTNICSRDGYPSYATLARWRAERVDFDHALQIAMRSRAEIYHDKVAHDIDKVIDKDQVAAENLRFSKLKWLAMVNDRKKFGGNVSTEDSNKSNMTIIIDTGIKE